MSKPSGLPAGDFSQWLRDAGASLRSGNGGADVPCGNCNACCRSSMFIHITPTETRTIQRIPRALLFPAPGLPKGHLLMGYSDKGHCPMLVDDRCSIYVDRPQTCRTYDCRIYAATGVPVDERTQAAIADRVRAWVFDHKDDGGRDEHRLVKETAAFLLKNRDLFPQGTLPTQPAHLAALAIRAYKLFANASGRPDAGVAQAILEALDQANPSADRRPNKSSQRRPKLVR
jgi:uncharacterized protein